MDTRTAFEGKGYKLEIASTEGGAVLRGSLGAFMVLDTPVFSATLETVGGGRDITLDSRSGFRDVSLRQRGNTVTMLFSAPLLAEYEDISFFVRGVFDDDGVSFYSSVLNNSRKYSVGEVYYPSPVLRSESYDLLMPHSCGRLVKNAETVHSFHKFDYPQQKCPMQYFAFTSGGKSVYLGVHDERASSKSFYLHCDGEQVHVGVSFYAIGAGLPANSFELSGYIRWQVVDGDWYDATAIYARFVHENARWLSEKDENGRIGTDQKYKDIAFWVTDYIPNSEEQRDCMPMTLGAVASLYPADYWYKAPIELARALGGTVGYHVYNWHRIPFNVCYPHFLPARDVFVEHLPELQANNVLVFPYINTLSWETRDSLLGYEENFENTGIHGSVRLKDNPCRVEIYPQLTVEGEKTRLASMCPTFPVWRQIVKNTVRGLENDVGVDGVYYDQTGHVHSLPCRNPAHPHLPGGGSYWSDTVNLTMDHINADRKEETFYFTENNNEPYVKGFDGMLTWLWTGDNQVPAFPMIYAGYVEMIGRFSDGKLRDDDFFFRFQLAESLLFGQQLGWINAHVVYNDSRMYFLKQVVNARSAHKGLFYGSLLRPPMVETDLPIIRTSGKKLRPVLAGAWRNGDRATLFVINISDSSAHYTLTVDEEQYRGLPKEALQGVLDAFEVRAIDF